MANTASTKVVDPQIATLTEENATLKADNELLEAENAALREQIQMRGLQPADPPLVKRHVPVVHEHGLLAPTSGATGKTEALPAEVADRPGPPVSDR